MQNHVSVRKYTSDAIPKEHLMEIIRTAQSAASSHFVQAYSIVHVKDQDKKHKIAELSKNPQVGQCSDFLLFCGDLKRLQYACRKHGVEMVYDSVEMLIVAMVDVALIAQNAITAAESLGYGGCYIGGVRNQPDAISKLVALPDMVIPVFGLTLGIPAQQNEVKPRLPMEAIYHENEYDETKYDQLLDQYDETMQVYYRMRSSNNKNMSWTKAMAEFMKEKRRVHMRKFLESKGFKQLF